MIEASLVLRCAFDGRTARNNLTPFAEIPAEKIQVFALFAPYGLLVLIPINVMETPSDSDQSQTNINTFNRLSMSNVQHYNPCMWLHALGIYLLSALAMYFLVVEYRCVPFFFFFSSSCGPLERVCECLTPFFFFLSFAFFSLSSDQANAREVAFDGTGVTPCVVKSVARKDKAVVFRTPLIMQAFQIVVFCRSTDV